MDNLKKLEVLMLAVAYYDRFDEKTMSQNDKDRLDAVATEIDKGIDEIVPRFATKTPVANNTKPGPEPAPKVVGAPEVPKPKAEAPKKTEIPADVLVMVKPYYECSIEQKKGVEPKKIKFEDNKLELPAFVDEKSAKQFGNVYPTVDYLELVLDQAWNMAAAGKSNAEVNTLLKKELGAMYAKNGLAVDNDFYKISNPYSKLTKIIRKAFGEGYEDYRFVVTRPSYTLFNDSAEAIVMKKEADCSKSKEALDAEKAKKPEPKAEMKTVQTQKNEKKPEPTKPVETAKPAEKPVEAPADKVTPSNDEEAQENTPEVETEPEVETPAVEEKATPAPKVEVAPETDEDADGKAPVVNKFEDFNDLENMIFEKIKAGNAKAAKEPNADKQRTIKAEAREDAKLLIQAMFEGEEWAQKDDKGFWKPEFMKYWNAILKEIGTNANVK
jgi:hypothetical protein